MVRLSQSRGGVAYFTRNSKYNGPARVTITDDTGQKTVSTRYLNENHIGVFIESEKQSQILSKVISDAFVSIDGILLRGKPFGLRTYFLMNPVKNGKPDTLYDNPQKNGLLINGLINGKRSIKYAPYNYPITDNIDQIDKFKVNVPEAFGSGKFGEIIPKPFITKPKELVTETFLNFGPFSTLCEAESALKYIKTKFCRTMIGIKKKTLHSKTAWTYVPLQDFTENSDIDWTQSIHEIDRQLYKKYKLSANEIQYIEENVKEME